MIEIKPINTNRINTVQMVVTEGADVLGSVTIYLQETNADLSELKTTDALDFSLLYGLGKAALNYADLHGAKTATCHDDRMADFVKTLRFAKNGDVWTLTLEGYFESGCHA